MRQRLEMTSILQRQIMTVSWQRSFCDKKLHQIKPTVVTLGVIDDTPPAAPKPYGASVTLGGADPVTGDPVTAGSRASKIAIA